MANILLFFKPISDLFYQYPVIDYVLLAFSFLVAAIVLKKIGRVYWTDLIVILLMFLLTISLINNANGIYTYVKITSAFLLYFIGRGSYQRREQNDRAIVYSHIIVLLMNACLLLVNSGFNTWGQASTFRGFYFYKSDLAVAMIYVLSVFLFLVKMRFVWKAIAIPSAGLMIILSNSRISILISVLIFVLGFVYYREKKGESNKELFKLTPKVIVLCFFAVIISIYIIQWIGNLPWFRQSNYLSFSFDSYSDLGNASNTQGRSVIWNSVLKSFNAKPFVTRMFGVDLVSDTWRTFESHSSYVKMLFCTGYVGLSLFIVFFVLSSTRINKIKSRNRFFFMIAMLACFLIQSASQSAIAFTQMTWILFYYIGLTITMSYKEEDGAVSYDEVEMRRVIVKKISSGRIQ